MRPAEISEISILHIDSDWYDPVKLCLETFYSRVNPRGIIILNDYNQWLGSNRAAEDFMTERNLDITIHPLGKMGAYFFASNLSSR